MQYNHNRLEMQNKLSKTIGLVILILVNVQCQTEKQNNDEPIIIKESKTRLISQDEFSAFQDNLNTLYSIKEKQTTSNQLEKLSKESSQKFLINLTAKQLHNNKHSYFKDRRQRIRISIFNYPSLEFGRKAKTNLLNCFPSDCQRIKEGENIGAKTTPALYILDERYIAIIQISCEDVTEE